MTTKQHITFPIADENHPYAGMPLFDGCPEHYDQYMDALLDYVGLEGAVFWANKYSHDYKLQTGEHAGATIPGAFLWGENTDSVQGYKTDFPCIVGLGQTWNKELVHQVGEVIGHEYIGQTNFSAANSDQFSAMICTAMQDMRVNPLSGRFDEGFSEDPMLSSEFVETMAAGVSGVDAEENKQGFWEKCLVVTKHFTTYGGQTFRMSQSNDLSMRGLMEHQVKAPTKGISSGAVGGVMLSFGRTNGVPNTLSPAISYIQSLSPYGLYTTPDIFGDSMFWKRDVYKDGHGNFSNGYDQSYIDPEYQKITSAIMAHAEASGYEMNPEHVNEDVLEMVRIAAAGVCGVEVEEIRKEAKNSMAAYVRNGYLNASPEDYPFLSENADKADEHEEYHRMTSLQAARECAVLLKNDGILPLSGKEKICVSGFAAASRFKTLYAARNLPRMEHCGMTVADSIKLFTEEAGGSSIFHSDGKIVKIKCNGKYLMVTDKDENSENFGAIGFTKNVDEAEVFEQYSWGQYRGFSFRSVESGRWFSSNGVSPSFLIPEQPTVLKVNQDVSLVNKDTILTAVSSNMILPPRMRLEDNDDGSCRILIHGYNESLIQKSPAAYYEYGRYIIEDGDTIAFTAPLQNEENADNLRKAAAKFTFDVVKEPGTSTIEEKDKFMPDVAIVTVGTATRHSSGEGSDRSDLALGEDQYTLVERVAQAYPKKTIVVLKTSYPVLMKKIQENENIAAIVYQPYAGQYDGYALGEVLFGKYAPTGRLTATWYASMDALPKLDAYSVPEGPDTEYTPYNMDPRWTCDLRKQDLISEKLTYQYTDAEITYPMGYGLGYSTFSYANLKADAWEDVTKPWQLSVEVTNNGNVKTSEVVQVYMHNADAAYGKAAPRQVLAAFAKAEAAPGETKELILTVKPQDVAIWDVNAGKYIVEKGNYRVSVGASSTDVRLTADIPVNGTELSSLSTTDKFGLFNRSYLAHQVTYREYGKKNTLENLKHQKGLDGIDRTYYSVMSKQDGAWAGMKKAALDGKTNISIRVASIHTENTVELRLDSPDGECLASISFGNTEPVEYRIPNTGAKADQYPEMKVRELGYTDIVGKLNKSVSGIHDLYLVFRNPDIRLAEMQID